MNFDQMKHAIVTQTEDQVFLFASTNTAKMFLNSLGRHLPTNFEIEQTISRAEIKNPNGFTTHFISSSSSPEPYEDMKLSYVSEFVSPEGKWLKRTLSDMVKQANAYEQKQKGEHNDQ